MVSVAHEVFCKVYKDGLRPRLIGPATSDCKGLTSKNKTNVNLKSNRA